MSKMLCINFYHSSLSHIPFHRWKEMNCKVFFLLLLLYFLSWMKWFLGWLVAYLFNNIITDSKWIYVEGERMERSQSDFIKIRPNDGTKNEICNRFWLAQKLPGMRFICKKKIALLKIEYLTTTEWNCL